MYALSRQKVELDHEVPGPVNDELPLGFPAAQHDRHASLQQDHDVVCRITLAKEYLADFGRPDLPERCKQAQLLVRQLRKYRGVVFI